MVYQTAETTYEGQKIEAGNVVSFTGRWSGREDNGHLLIFAARHIVVEDHSVIMKHIDILNSAAQFIKEHHEEQERKEKEERESMTLTSN